MYLHLHLEDSTEKIRFAPKLHKDHKYELLFEVLRERSDWDSWSIEWELKEGEFEPPSLGL